MINLKINTCNILCVLKSKGLKVCLPTGSCTVIFVWYESYIVDNSQNVRHSILRLWFARAVKKIKTNSCELVCTWAENFWVATFVQWTKNNIQIQTYLTQDFMSLRETTLHAMLNVASAVWIWYTLHVEIKKLIYDVFYLDK